MKEYLNIRNLPRLLSLGWLLCGFLVILFIEFVCLRQCMGDAAMSLITGAMTVAACVAVYILVNHLSVASYFPTLVVIVETLLVFNLILWWVAVTNGWLVFN